MRATTGDIREAAGYWNGEGHVKKDRYGQTEITQKHPQTLLWLCEKFGGTVRYRVTDGDWSWGLHGADGRGFLMMIYQFQPDYRKAQIKEALDAWRSRGRTQEENKLELSA